MHAASELVLDRVAPLPPATSTRLAVISDAELLATTQRLAGTSNQVFAALLEHLAEVDARGLHRTRACSSLYTYCIYELRFSEDAAARRSAAAKLVRRFPAILGAVAAGEIHLTGLLMLAQHLTEENHLEVLGRAKFRTKKELARLVRRMAPLPAAPDRVEPLGPVRSEVPRDPTWTEFVESLCPPVRELPVGERPGDWVEGPLGANVSRVDGERPVAESPAPASLGRFDDAPLLYEVQFTATAEHAELLERARALLSQRSPKVGLGDLHLQAMRLLVQMLEKQRYGAGTDVHAEPPRDSATRDEADPECVDVPPVAESEVAVPPRRRGRYIPASIRRAVFERDGHRCAYFDERGVRCRETRYLELHHLEPFARGGPHRLDNLTVRCQAHNALAAEEDFGREHLRHRRDGCRHESRGRML
jgi:hypothetical protein